MTSEFTTEGKSKELSMYLNLMMVLKKNKVSQKSLAVEMGITQKTLSKKLNGVTDWTLGEAKYIWARFPNESPDYLMEKNNG